ncbi:MAG TPA: glycosyltransferase family 4 protein [Rhizomicrobium sp.]|nr:glycosyltransferase family 4 protein [Rhizomicrobium sp.]
MRIAFVIYSLSGGGAERVTAILAQHWADTGHEVRVMTFADENANFYKLKSNVEYETLRCASAGMTLWKKIVLNLSRILKLRRRLKIFQPDVVIGMMSTTSAIVALASIGLRCTAVGSERVHPPLDPLPPFQNFIRNVSYRFHDVVVAQTKESAQWIRTHTAARTVHVIPNPLAWPLDAKEPILAPADFCPAGRFVILAVGRLVPQKGFDSIISAFAAIYKDRPSWDLVILGTGPDRRSLETQIDQLGLKGRVFLPGRVGNVGDWYKRASIFAMTSRFEGFPNALLEAMAYGLPVISMDCDTGPRDLIEHNVNGLLIASGDQAAFAEGLQQLMEDEDLRRQLSEKARDVIKRYAIGDISEQWLSCFNSPGTNKR